MEMTGGSMEDMSASMAGRAEPIQGSAMPGMDFVLSWIAVGVLSAGTI